MLDNFEKYRQLRERYKTFVYEDFKIQDNSEEIILEYYFKIENLTEFRPKIKILKKQYVKQEKIKFSEQFAFCIGLIELISYWKATCSPNVIIKCGKLNQEQINWFKKLYFNGLGELFFTNNIQNNINDFMNIVCESEKDRNFENIQNDEYSGYIFPIGGGKDSCVTMEILKNTELNNYCLIVNPKEVTLNCAKIAGFSDNEIIEIYREIDKNLIELNNKGFINGHTPFSALLAFVSYYIGFLTGKKYVALSNEVSSNESNMQGEKVNHQYSKSFEFESDFREYVKKYFNTGVEYFSFLRPLNELQIAKAFSKLEKYHKVFKSCNKGSIQNTWKWCCNCPKCLFVFIILSPFLYKQRLVDIFGEDLFEKQELLETFVELTGNGKLKPFECVGTFEEVNFAIANTICNLQNKNSCLPFLLKYYKDNFDFTDVSKDLTREYNKINNLTEKQSELLKKWIDIF